MQTESNAWQNIVNSEHLVVIETTSSQHRLLQAFISATSPPSRPKLVPLNVTSQLRPGLLTLAASAPVGMGTGCVSELHRQVKSGTSDDKLAAGDAPVPVWRRRSHRNITSVAAAHYNSSAEPSPIRCRCLSAPPVSSSRLPKVPNSLSSLHSHRETTPRLNTSHRSIPFDSFCHFWQLAPPVRCQGEPGLHRFMPVFRQRRRKSERLRSPAAIFQEALCYDTRFCVKRC